MPQASDAVDIQLGATRRPITSFGETEAGELYAVTIDGAAVPGRGP